jgi:hypothetical protein
LNEGKFSPYNTWRFCFQLKARQNKFRNALFRAKVFRKNLSNSLLKCVSDCSAITGVLHPAFAQIRFQSRFRNIRVVKTSFPEAQHDLYLTHIFIVTYMEIWRSASEGTVAKVTKFMLSYGSN